ncbi:MAG: translation initiation factor IF-3 [bacterium]
MRRQHFNQTPQLVVRINERIRVPEVFLVDETGTARGKVPTPEALALARAAELDLVEVSPNAQPPVAKILDFGKYRYEQTKALARAKKKQKEGEVKEIRLGFKIDDHDFEVKALRAEKFLSQGNKVKAAVMFRGREITHVDLGNQLLKRFVDRLQGVARMEQAPLRQGRSIHTILTASK